MLLEHRKIMHGRTWPRMWDDMSYACAVEIYERKRKTADSLYWAASIVLVISTVAFIYWS